MGKRMKLVEENGNVREELSWWGDKLATRNLNWCKGMETSSRRKQGARKKRKVGYGELREDMEDIILFIMKLLSPVFPCTGGRVIRLHGYVKWAFR